MTFGGLQLSPLRTNEESIKDQTEIGNNLLKGLQKDKDPQPKPAKELELQGASSYGFTSFTGKDGNSYSTSYTYSKDKGFNSQTTVRDPKGNLIPKEDVKPNPDLAKAESYAAAKKKEFTTPPPSADEVLTTASKKAKAGQTASAEAEKNAKSAAAWNKAADTAKSPKAEVVARKEAKNFLEKEVKARETAVAVGKEEVAASEKGLKLAKSEAAAKPKDAKLQKKVKDAELAFGNAKHRLMVANADLWAAQSGAKATDIKLAEAKSKTGATSTALSAKSKPSPKTVKTASNNKV